MHVVNVNEWKNVMMLVTFNVRQITVLSMEIAIVYQISLMWEFLVYT